MKVLLAHPGTQHAPRLARELERHALLGEFWTGLALREGGLPSWLARRCRRWPALAGLGSRVVSGVPGNRLHTLPGVEIAALRRLRAGEDAHHTLHERNRVFQKKIPDRAIADNDAVIAFDTSGWVLGERAQRAGRPFFLDRSIAHPAAYAQIMQALNRQFPDWAVRLEDRPAEVAAAEAREHELAHRVVVGGAFARDTLVAAGIPAAKIRINPYGVDWSAFAPAPDAPPGRRPFRFLYVGSVQTRKGVPVLLEAWRRLAPPAAELWIAGGIGPRERGLLPTLPGLRFLGQVPRAEISALYAQADVFVLPSLFEGFGLVLLEAVAAGLPIIATRHTGAVELLNNSPVGELVTAGSVEELAGALQRWQAEPGAHRKKMIAARPQLEAEFSWEAYGDRWVRLLEEPA